MMCSIENQDNKEGKAYGQECKGVNYVFRW